MEDDCDIPTEYSLDLCKDPLTSLDTRCPKGSGECNKQSALLRDCNGTANIAVHLMVKLYMVLCGMILWTGRYDRMKWQYQNQRWRQRSSHLTLKRPQTGSPCSLLWALIVVQIVTYGLWICLLRRKNHQTKVNMRGPSDMKAKALGRKMLCLNM